MSNPTGWTGGSAEKLHYLLDNEIALFFKAVESQKDLVARKRDLCLFNLMLSYGLRTAEVPLIKLEHINLLVRPPQIYITRVKRKRNPKTGEPKPRLGQWYDLSDRNEAVIRAWLKARTKCKHAETSPFLFATRETGQISLMNIYNLAVKYGKVAGLKVHPHMFRHSCGIRLAKAGRNSFAIKSRLGHVSVLSTEVYVQIAGKDRHEEDRKDDRALEGTDDL